GIRGESDSQHIVMETDDVEVYLRIASGSRTILGQLLRTNGDFLAGARTELLGNGQLVDMTVTDSLGEFRFKTAPEGDLRLQAEISSDCRLIAALDFSKPRRK